ncbi:3-oxoacyl-ACP synthase [Streptomyces albidoflavus]|uniref:beta-ketoacyl-ACP synthase III n=1 Tax=Streptomyces albidoflavus TaxID=1886 RepID=UPI000BAE6513|nr:beta-ketoacyl-ACP synthase III [Streptomyces albidoflavus]PAX86122.1 3-oxoacyl-ACP synthase [Streptomyces albidoflavus]PAX88877.1 3-oxoacyl-ACP synthase [Streptomyces albidoflavus]PBO16612.1 3-oxoacyl-ACP synthase [Streptomyces albidoflavus]PBO21160.1 3-oxoacyl-ACP synthase [Streptomyces albidoflavus]PBO27916.1 3-oxoacyl-ACP synthase [Streptomyces albidoflavus]
MLETSPRGPARAAVLCGVGGQLPRLKVGNDELAERLDTDDAWIRTRTGIRSRHFAAPDEATSDLAVAAGRRALANSGSAAVGAVIVATTTPDRSCPSTAPLVAARLGLTGVAAFDVGAVCSGFVYALAAGTGLITSGVTDRVLVVGADVYSRIVDPGDRQNAVVFGDGAGAVVLRAGHATEPGALGPFDLGSDGAHEDMVIVQAGGSRLPFDPARTSHAERHFSMRGKEVYRHAVSRMAGSAQAVLEQAGVSVGEIDLFVPHQANLRILRTVATGLGLSFERCATHVQEAGNTGAASIPLALARSHVDGALTVGDRVLLTGFGGGLTWGSCLLTWSSLPPAVEPSRPEEGVAS